MKTLLLALILVVCVAAEQKHYHGHFNEEMDLDRFQTYEDVMVFLNQRVGTCAAGLTSTVNIDGHSKAGRGLTKLTLSTAPAANKPIFFTDRMTNSQEWITVSTLLKVIKHMCTNYGTDATVTHLLDTYDFVFLPIQDPDDYELTRSHDRMSNTNHGVDDEAGSSCIGIDLNSSSEGATGLAHYDEYADCTGGDCTFLSDCADGYYCNMGRCCTADDGDVCYGHCLYFSDCAQDEYCNGKYYMCCEPPPEEDCITQCFYMSDCNEYTYCHGTYRLCCAPPPDEDCAGHCYYMSDCNTQTYCHGSMGMCCHPPPDEDCAGHCFYLSDCNTQTYCHSSMGMCCHPPPDMQCLGQCYYLSDCAITTYCHHQMYMCCDPPDDMQCLGHCTTHSDCSYDDLCNMTMNMCCYAGVGVNAPGRQDEIEQEEPISELTDESVKEDYGVEYPFCIEIRGNTFITDARQIQDSFQVIWASIVAAINENEAMHSQL